MEAQNEKIKKNTIFTNSGLRLLEKDNILLGAGKLISDNIHFCKGKGKVW